MTPSLSGARFFLCAIMALAISSCTVDATDPNVDGDNATPTATATVNGTPLTFTSMVLDRGSIIPFNGGDSYTANTVKLAANDGSTIEVRWDHEATATFTTLKSGYADSPGATYTSPGGKKYHSISGKIAVNKYEQPQLDYVTSGTFEFVGQVPFEADTVRITNGTFTNVHN